MMTSNQRQAWNLFRQLTCLIVFSIQIIAESHPPLTSGWVLRVRLADGSMQRIEVNETAIGTTSLHDALSVVLPKLDGLSIREGNSPTTMDPSRTLQELGLKHGSLITVSSSTTTTPFVKQQRSQRSALDNQARFDPFPDLAKDYVGAIRKRALQRRSGSSSYSDLAKIQSELHVVEPQPKGRILRVYMCRASAERFQVSAAKSNQCRAAILLGSFSRERIDSKPRPKTSLSSVTEDQEYCTVAKVHAIWEPKGNPSEAHYDPDALIQFRKDVRAMQIAKWLGLEPIGWIFTYRDDRHKDDDSLPVWSLDVHTGAMLQIENMKTASKDHEIDDIGARFVTLAMDGQTGATEAFQLSDVSVQMVAEQLIVVDEKKRSSRYVPTLHSILVDGQETQQLDTVLCLVNTAMMSHDGIFAGKATTVNKLGTLSKKARKSLIKLLDYDDSLEELCNFHTILALYNMGLSNSECETLCHVVQRWRLGQKKGTALGEQLKRRVKSLIDFP